MTDDKLEYDDRNALSHVLVSRMRYHATDRLFNPMVVEATYYFPAGEVEEYDHAVGTLYDAVRQDSLPARVLNYELSGGPRHVDQQENGERLMTVDGDVTITADWPVIRIRSTPVGVVKLSVEMYPERDSHMRVFNHYDNEIVQRTTDCHPNDIRLLEQDSGTKFSLTTDSECPSIAFPPKNMKLNHFRVC
ncbi:hypothetical protein [Haloferax elongans]|uniref:hypothetical protein n=1 Tax=Haloferax elongans TaxID=403191 RepID=UPI000677EFEB|nr:hypothetical protein [Haloferax elongans]